MVDGTPTLGEGTEGGPWIKVAFSLWEDWTRVAWIK